jgi:hypothetical protein
MSHISLLLCDKRAMQWLRVLIACLSTQSLGFDPRPVHTERLMEDGTGTGFSSGTAIVVSLRMCFR